MDDIDALTARAHEEFDPDPARPFIHVAVDTPRKVLAALETQYARANDAHRLLDENAETMDQQEEWLEQAHVQISKLEAALTAFRKAKDWVAADSYDGIDERGRQLLDEADGQARVVLAGWPEERDGKQDQPMQKNKFRIWVDGLEDEDDAVEIEADAAKTAVYAWVNQQEFTSVEDYPDGLEVLVATDGDPQVELFRITTDWEPIFSAYKIDP